ncbi:MAG TPA: glycosyltransferase family A protein [Dongiaceae bacterium]|nr:glycosyltransferase family A protein [Dongiaceae bacterium]
MAQIDLICLTTGVPGFTWDLGWLVTAHPEPALLARAVEQLRADSKADAVLFWDAALGTPDASLMQRLLSGPGDCWHNGLLQGMGGLPGILDFISPTWMLSADPPADREGTSWRLSLRACLVRMPVLRQLGGPQAGFITLAGAALELGHRWISRGAILRHVPGFAPVQPAPPPALLFEDELRLAYYRHGRKWARWALWRAKQTGRVSRGEAALVAQKVFKLPVPAQPRPLGHQVPADAPFDRVAQVTILIPTVDRYSYLRTLFAQLRLQTVPPLEIIVVDQTAPDRRDRTLASEFADLPLKWMVQDDPGQCTSRNAGLLAARGDYVLFIDDDDEVTPNLIELHLQALAWFGAEVSCGVAEEVGAGALPPEFQLCRVSDVFPTNNSLIRREVLRRSGLFDLAYNRMPRADGDLGMRLYLAGALMILSPGISVLHHHAPAGGLRKHKARTITYAMSRTHIGCRALTHASELYLAGRYFPESHQTETMWQSALGTFSIRGGWAKKIAKVLVSGLMLPATLRTLRARVATARAMRTQFPQIPALPSTPGPDAAN